MQTIWLGEPGDEPVEEEEDQIIGDEREASPRERRRQARQSSASRERSRQAPPRDSIEPAYPYDEEPVQVVETMDAQLINWRGRLTEFCQKRDLILPDVNEINPVGARGTFSFVCKFRWGKSNSPPLLTLRTCGTAKKKKFAKREAARLMCRRLSDLTNFLEPVENEHNPEDRGYWGPSFPACPRSADESGEVCPPLGYEEFDHSEPLPDLYGYGDGFDDDGYGGGYNSTAPAPDPAPRGGSMYLSKSKAPWEKDDEPRGSRGGSGYGPEAAGPMSKRRRFGDYGDREDEYDPRSSGSWGNDRSGRSRGSWNQGRSTGGWGDSGKRGAGSLFLK